MFCVNILVAICKAQQKREKKNEKKKKEIGEEDNMLNEEQKDGSLDNDI